MTFWLLVWLSAVIIAAVLFAIFFGIPAKRADEAWGREDDDHV